ncbi:uncharacterized protein LOC127858871 [Dreissena polymorpha]|uniref:uncharacterized protein LOC127858871 n=1 Tax=Dreissena polymorpha TaxID=45954 RepID=UPI00226435D9|nr:uncharacterized protein LOC127858871 [Dreissena polymorpha]
MEWLDVSFEEEVVTAQHDPKRTVDMMTLTLLLLILMECRPTLYSLFHREVYATDGETINLEFDGKQPFQITFSQSNDTFTIGGCSSFDVCYFMNSSLTEKYKLKLTSKVGHLTLLNISNDHYGKYTSIRLHTEDTESMSYSVLPRYNMVKNGCGGAGTIFSVWTVLGYLTWTCVVQSLLMLSSRIY